MRMPEEYNGRMPFYLTYPMPNVYQTEKEYERDMERMKELYPKRMKKLLAYVEEECDKMEYEGSEMYDEYPDKVLLCSCMMRCTGGGAGAGAAAADGGRAVIVIGCTGPKSSFLVL